MTALGIGFIQCLSMIPGISRSGATIIGALSLGVERKTAAEYSFFLAVPTMLAASGYDLLKSGEQLGEMFAAADAQPDVGLDADLALDLGLEHAEVAIEGAAVVAAHDLVEVEPLGGDLDAERRASVVAA